jgi:hypothetical protein
LNRFLGIEMLRPMTWTRARYLGGAVAAGVLVILLTADYYLVRSCGDSQFQEAKRLWILAAILAFVAVALFKAGPTNEWIVALVMAPIVAFVVAVVVGFWGESSGYCGRF